MARLPQVGGDDGNWGDILNDYLGQAHGADGLLKDGSVVKAKLETSVQASLGRADAAVKTVNGGAPNGAGNVALSLTKSDVGLGNVDNTADANKPVSTATQAALSAKEPTITVGTTAQYLRGDKTFQTLDKAAAGLANVDNTSDANKPVSTAAQTALNSRPPFVFVVTGSEARPTGTYVVWVGGSTRPTNTLAGDLWLSE